MKTIVFLTVIITSSLVISADDLPILVLNGESIIKLNKNDQYTELGATAFDNVDGEISSNVIINGKVNSNQQGLYVVSYKVNNKKGNCATKNRLVKVFISKDKKKSEMNKDTIPPEINLSGDSIVTILKGGTYEEPAINANDNIDGDITAHIETAGDADPKKQGLYEIIYYIQDKAGNIALKKFYVNVVLSLTNTKKITSDTVSLIPAIKAETFKEKKAHNSKMIITLTTIAVTAGFTAVGLIYDFALLPQRQKEFNSANTIDSYNLCLNKLKQTERIRNACYIGSGIGIIGLSIYFSIPELEK